MAIAVLKALWKCFKFILIIVVAVEALCFMAMMLHNYTLYGNVYSHVPVRYDPETLFLMLDRNPPSDFNSISADPQLNRIVWMFGGSTVRCNAHENQNQTLPALLSKFLNEKAGPHHFTVVNFGENGFNSILESKYLQKALAQSHDPPHLVIFYDGANDCFQYAEYREPVGHTGYRRLKAFIESYRMGWFGLLKPINAAVYASYTNEFMDRVRMLRDPVQPNSPTLQKMIELAIQRYDHIAKVVHCYDAEFLLIWQPMLWVEDCQVGEKIKQDERARFVDAEKFPDLKQSVSLTYNKLECVLWDKPYFASLRNALCQRTTALFQPDGIHLTSEGNGVIAGHISELLINRFRERLFTRASREGCKSPLGPIRQNATDFLPNSR